MVYGFVRQLGGHIQIYSELVARDEHQDFPAPDEAVQTSSELGLGGPETATLPRGSESILVVEDDARVRRVTTARLRSLGYEAREADSGAAALHLLAAHPNIAMLFTDVVMPGGMNGDELAEAALAANPDPQFLSPPATLNQRSRALERAPG